MLKSRLFLYRRMSSFPGFRWSQWSEPSVYSRGVFAQVLVCSNFAYPMEPWGMSLNTPVVLSIHYRHYRLSGHGCTFFNNGYVRLSQSGLMKSCHSVTQPVSHSDKSMRENIRTDCPWEYTGNIGAYRSYACLWCDSNQTGSNRHL